MRIHPTKHNFMHHSTGNSTATDTSTPANHPCQTLLPLTLDSMSTQRRTIHTHCAATRHFSIDRHVTVAPNLAAAPNVTTHRNFTGDRNYTGDRRASLNRKTTTWNFAFIIFLALTLLLAPPSPAEATQPQQTAPVSAEKTPPAHPSLRQMAGQMLLVGFRGTDVNDDSWIAKAIAKDNLGGVILFDYDVALAKPARNIASPQQVQHLTRKLGDMATTPLFVAVDMEGGKVQRLKPDYGYPAFPSAAELGTRLVKDITESARRMGELLAENGFNLDFAPVVDVNVNPESPAIGKIGRSFSADPQKVAADAEAFIDGLHQSGVLSSLKHFPGHGSASADSHLGVTDVTRTWSDEELIPYKRLMADGKIDMIMTAHIFNATLDADHPATLSRNVVTRLLREKLGYHGVVATDDLQMKAVATQYGLKDTIKLALQAGCDILLFGNNLGYDPKIVTKTLDIIEELVAENELTTERISESYDRIMRLKTTL